MAARFATWLLTTCHVTIVLVAHTALPTQQKEDTNVMIQGMSLIQQKRATVRLGHRDPTTCTEAVLVEPRAIHYTAVALNSAVGAPGIDLITFAHSRKNAKFAKRLVKRNAKLENASIKGSLQLLELQVGDLGGDAVVNEMPTGMVQENSSSTNAYHHEYTRLMLSPGFWKLWRCDRILIFQSDTVFCRNSSVRLEDFATFPYIGGESPFLTRYGRIHMNGGFSLRSRVAMLQCIEHATQEGLLSTDMGEDEIYSQCPHLKQPPLELIDRFAIDNAMKIPKSAPLGVHRPWGDGPFFAQVAEMCDGTQALYDAYSVEHERS